MTAALRVAHVLAVATALAIVSPTAHADDLSRKVRSACAGDAKRLCPKHKFGSSSLRYCMEANSHNFSRSCVRALEDDGVVPRGSLR